MPGSADGSDKAKASYCLDVCGLVCGMPASVKPEDAKAWHLRALATEQHKSWAKERGLSEHDEEVFGNDDDELY